MNSFKHLESLEVPKEATAEFTLYDIENPDGTFPVLILASATEANKRYFNKLLRRSRRNMSKVQAQDFDVSMLKANRDDDRVLYPKYVVKGWRHVQDVKGKEVTFSEENCTGFIKVLPGWIFDSVRLFAGKPRNFIEGDLPDEEETAGNLQEG